MSQNYIATNWEDNKTVGTASVMNNMEKGIENAHDRIDEVDSQIKDIEKKIINPRNYGAVGNGVVDDTKSFKDALLDLQNGGIFLLPDGDYVISEVDFSNKNNCIFNFSGKLFIKSNIDTPYGAVKFGGKNNIVNGLFIDGNRENVNQTTAFGVTANINVKNGTENLTFNNLISNNSLFSSIITDGSLKNLKIINASFSNIGEHVIYMSGGNNENIYFENIKVENINLNSNNVATSHESYFIKSAGGNNKKIYVNGLIQTQSITPAVKALTFLHAGSDDVLFENIYLGENVNFAIISKDSKKIIVKNLINTKGDIIYNLSKYSYDVDFEIYNSIINGTQNNFNIVKLFDNCILNIDNNYEGVNDSLYNKDCLIFNNCKINANGGLIRLPYLTKNVEFNNCDIKSNETVSNNLITIGSSSVEDDMKIKIKDCKIKVSGYNNFINSINEKTNLDVINTIIDKSVTGKYNVVTIKDVNTTSLDFAILGQLINFKTLKIRNITKDGESFTKKRLVKTISTDSVFIVNLNYGMCRVPQLKDIVISPLSDTNGITLIPSITNTSIYVNCSSTPTSPIDFCIYIDVED